MGLANVAEIAASRIDQRIKARKYRDDPVLWATEYLGLTLWSAQKDILYSIRDNRATAVAAGHSVGKSFIAAVAACWWIDVHPQNEVFVASTAPTVDQVSGILWRNIKVFHNLAAQRFKDGLVDHPLIGYVTGDNKWKSDDGILLGQGRKPSDDRADVAFQGVHATYLLAIGDEATGLNEEMIGALGNIATGARNRQLLIANPTDPSCEMAQIWKKELDGWTRMHISVLDSPLITGEEGFDASRAEGMSGWEYVNEKREQWGEDDPRYISRVLGQWAFEAGNTVFTEEEIARCINTVVIPDPERGIHLGCDIAFSQEGDFSSTYKREVGEVWEVDDTGKPTVATGREGYRIRLVDKWKGAPLVGDQPGNEATDTRIDLAARNIGASVVKLDAAGLGAGVLHSLMAKDLSYDLYKVLGNDAAMESKSYINARAEALFEMKLMARMGNLDLDGADEEMLDQLRGIVYEYDVRNRIKIMSKADMRKRGKKSPDFADAAWYAFYDPERGNGDDRPGVAVYEPDEFTMEYSDMRGMPV